MALAPRDGWALFPGQTFASGVNYPWNNYGWDFGLSKWDLAAGGDGKKGISLPANSTKIDADFAKFQQNGLRVVRWFVFADCRMGVTFDKLPGGTPTGVEPQVSTDLEALLGLAKNHSLQVELVLLDYKLTGNPDKSNGVDVWGHANLITDKTAGDQFINTVLVPLVTQFKGRAEIFSWEVINEPDWSVQGGTIDGVTMAQGVTWQLVLDFVARCAKAIHNTDPHALVTVGGGLNVNLGQWQAVADLDYYQIHYYPGMTLTSDLYTFLPKMRPPLKPFVVCWM